MPKPQIGYFYPLNRPDLGFPVDPDYGLPDGGGVDHPSNELPPGEDSPIFPGTPENPIVLPPGTIWPPLPPTMPAGKVWAFVWIRGHGHKWIVLDLKPGQGLPPPTAPQPK